MLDFEWLELARPFQNRTISKCDLRKVTVFKCFRILNGRISHISDPHYIGKKIHLRATLVIRPVGIVLKFSAQCLEGLKIDLGGSGTELVVADDGHHVGNFAHSFEPFAYILEWPSESKTWRS